MDISSSIPPPFFLIIYYARENKKLIVLIGHFEFLNGKKIVSTKLIPVQECKISFYDIEIAEKNNRW
jgi:hypothetical protein